MTEPTLVYITKGFTSAPRTIETLNETNDLHIGNVFNTVARHYKKDKSDYPRWISFDKNNSEFNIMKGHVEECATDLEKLNMVCDWLGEDPIS